MCMCVCTCAYICKETIVEIGKNTPEKMLQIVCIFVCYTRGNILKNIFCSSVPFNSEVFKLNTFGEQRMNLCHKLMSKANGVCVKTATLVKGTHIWISR